MRTSALHTPLLATAHTRTGNLDAAADHGQQALALARHGHSRRVAPRLHQLTYMLPAPHRQAATFQDWAQDPDGDVEVAAAGGQGGVGVRKITALKVISVAFSTRAARVWPVGLADGQGDRLPARRGGYERASFDPLWSPNLHPN
ncbi:hypothetical protein OHR68_20245 [Spirillospora sp. NBC_00431]